MNYDASVLEKLLQGTSQVLPEGGLKEKLLKNRPLKIKLGMDPTAPDLHLGHAVVLSKMREFQDLGHEIIVLIGDFTARIGDPTGKSKTRPPLDLEQIAHNMKTYFDQIGRVLDINRLTVVYNASWLSALSASDMVQLCAKVTLARLIEREDFAQRIAKHQTIGFHELLYPLLQGYDSVELQADVELGGTDQTFNLIMGRLLQEQYHQEPQVVMTMPLLEGLDGIQKMSKSLDNAIGFADPAHEAYGKIMSISDTLMWRYYQLLLGRSVQDVQVMQEKIGEGSLHPMDCKKQLAHDIVSKFWSSQEAQQSQQTFEALFQKKDYAQAQEIAMPTNSANPMWIVDLLKTLGAVETSSQAKRLLESGAVECDGQAIRDFKAQIQWHVGMIVKVGKHRIYKLAQ